ncbi:MAG: hypothetical protein FGM23_08510 [Alphaproteobacteria bacterium]|nr:hypothetical protein [Alphaproteobacteria bacterium]
MFLSQEDVAAGFFDPYVVRAVLGYFNEKFPEKSQLTPTEFKLVVDKISPTWSTVEEVHKKSKKWSKGVSHGSIKPNIYKAYKKIRDGYAFVKDNESKDKEGQDAERFTGTESFVDSIQKLLINQFVPEYILAHRTMSQKTEKFPEEHIEEIIYNLSPFNPKNIDRFIYSLIANFKIKKTKSQDGQVPERSKSHKIVLSILTESPTALLADKEMVDIYRISATSIHQHRDKIFGYAGAELIQEFVVAVAESVPERDWISTVVEEIEAARKMEEGRQPVVSR